METYISDFSQYVEYFKNLIENTTYALKDQGKISIDNFEYLVYDNYGEYIEEANKVYESEQKRPILVCVRNDGGVYDTSASVNTYIQGVIVEALGPLDWQEDLQVIFNTIAMANAKKTVRIGDATGVILISELPEYSPSHETVYAEEYISITLSANFVIYDQLLFADDIQFYINDSQLKVKSWGIGATDELKSDNRFGYTDNRAKFYPNISVMVLRVEFFHQVGNAASETIFRNALKNSNFGQIFNIVLKKGDEVLAEYPMIHHHSTIDAKSGSLIIIQSEFYPYSGITQRAGD